jgi:YcxB-like protein
MPFIFAAGFVFYLRVIIPMNVRHMFEQQKELSAPFEHDLTAEGLNSSSQFGYATRPWSFFRKWKQNKNLLLLYTSDLQFLLIPKRFCTAEQLAAIQLRLQEYKVPEDARHLRKRGCTIAVAIYIVLFIIGGILLAIQFRHMEP